MLSERAQVGATVYRETVVYRKSVQREIATDRGEYWTYWVRGHGKSLNSLPMADDTGQH